MLNCLICQASLRENSPILRAKALRAVSKTSFMNLVWIVKWTDSPTPFDHIIEEVNIPCLNLTG